MIIVIKNGSKETTFSITNWPGTIKNITINLSNYVIVLKDII